MIVIQILLGLAAAWSLTGALCIEPADDLHARLVTNAILAVGFLGLTLR